MNDLANDIVTQRLTALEKEVRLYKFLGMAILGVMGLVLVLGATVTKVPEEIRARRFVVVDANDKDLLDMWAAGPLPTLTLYDVNGQPRTQLDLLPDGSPRLYFADANKHIRLRLGAGGEGRSQIEIIDSNGHTIGKCRLRKNDETEGKCQTPARPRARANRASVNNALP